MAAGDLTTVADVKALSGIGGAGTAADAVVARLIAAASTFLSTATDRALAGPVSVSEIRDGSGGVELFTAESPIISIQSLVVGLVPIAAQVADGQPGYFINRGESISLYGYAFSRGKRNVRLSYTAGYVSIPADIVQACIELVESMYRRGTRDPLLASESTPATGMVTAYKVQDVPAFVQSVIDKYKKVVPL